MENKNILIEANNFKTHLRTYLKDLSNGLIYPNTNSEEMQEGEIYELHAVMHMINDLNKFIKTKKYNNTSYRLLYNTENEYDQKSSEQESEYSSILQETIQFKQFLNSYLTDLKSGKVYPHSHHGFSTSNIVFKETENNEKHYATALIDSFDKFISIKNNNIESFGLMNDEDTPESTK